MHGEGVLALDPAQERERQFRKAVIASAVVHAVLLVLVWMDPLALRSHRAPAGLPGVVQVDLVAGAPAPAPAKAPAKPRAAPPPPPPPPVERKVIPKEPTAPPQPKPKPAPEAKPKPVAPPVPEAAPEEGYEDVLAQLRAEEVKGAAVTGPAPQAGTAGAGAGGTAVVTPEVLAWMRRAKIHVTRAWVLAPGFRNQPLETEILVTLGPGGEVTSTRITRRSGNPWFDESVERAVSKASPLPAPPEADDWSFVFRPQDVF